MTQDFNLNRLASVQGVRVLNLNDLANALKPIVSSGEGLELTIVKEGKEPHQGVGYLDDGTMVVVEGGARPPRAPGARRPSPRCCRPPPDG